MAMLYLTLLLDMNLQLKFGEEPPAGLRWPKMGCLSNSRWMGSLIAGLDADLLSEHVPPEVLSQDDIQKIRRVNVLMVHIMVRYWFLCTLSADAPYNQQELFRELRVFRRFDRELADICIEKLQRHLWVNSEEVVVFALASPRTSVEEKRKLADAIISLPKGSHFYCSRSYDFYHFTTVLLGPTMPYPFMPCGQSPLKQPYIRFRTGGLWRPSTPLDDSLQLHISHHSDFLVHVYMIKSYTILSKGN
jgi:hypothetical protein